jgi:RNA polymerase sigma-70 factor (ECF subfamily)
LQLTELKRLSDNDLIERYFSSRNSHFFELLYKRYAMKVFAKCIALLKDVTVAQDATQEIFTKVYLNLSKYGGQSKFSTWLYSITYNYCIDLIRKKQKSDLLFTDDIERKLEIEDEVVDEELLSMEVGRLKVVLEKIPDGDRAILMMKYTDDMSIVEIAELLNKTESAVKMNILRAKEKARAVYKTLFPYEI